MPWGVAAAAISVGGAAYNQSQAGKAASKGSGPLTGAQDDLYTQAQNIAATPYTAYTGQRVAGLSANQQKAVDIAGSSSGPGSAAQSYIDKAGQQADFIGGNQWNTATASKYMNPYTQNVTDLALNKENQSYASTVNSQNAAATSTGAFGGDRAALGTAATASGHNYNQGAIEAEGQANAYNAAVSAWQADNSRANTAAQDYSKAGSDITNMTQSQIQNLMATGGAAQTVAQMKLDTGYNDYLDQRGWATNQLAPLESAVGRTPTLAPTMPANYASSLIGAGSALAGYMGKSNTSGGVSYDGSDASAGNTGYSYDGSSMGSPNDTTMGQYGADADIGGETAAAGTSGIDMSSIGDIDTSSFDYF